MSVDPNKLWEEIQKGEDSSLEFKEVNVNNKKVSTPHRNSVADEQPLQTTMAAA